MKKSLTDTYKGKKVFITGHTGFKGSWLIKIFDFLGAEVKGYALAPETNESLYYLIEADKKCNSIISDIRDLANLKNELIEFNPDFVFHLAAQPLVRESYDNPIDTFDINVIGTANILEAIRYCKKKVTTIIITTDKVYQNNEWIYPYRESDRLGGLDPYSASKACSELVVNSYLNSFFNLKHYHEHEKSIAVCRAGNVIGGGDWSKDRIIPDLIKAFYSEKQLQIRNPKSIRPWQHVLEPLFGYLILAAKLQKDPQIFSGAYNFGPNSNDVLSVKELVETSMKYLGIGTYEIVHEQIYRHEANILKLDISKAEDKLKWKPIYTAQEAIFHTMEWYKVYYNDSINVIKFMDSQIVDYLKLI